MKISDLRESVVLAETLSFTETARRLYTTQSALSKHVQTMEFDLGVQLFIRNQHGVHLSRAGRVFIDGAKRVLQHYDETLIALERLKSGVDSTLNIGYLAGASFLFMPEAIARFSERFPNIDLQPMTMEIDGILGALDSNDIDMGVTTEFVEFPATRFSKMPLYKDHVSVIVPHGHRLADQDSVSIRDLVGETVLLSNSTFMIRESPIIANLLAPVNDQIILKENVNDVMALFLLMRTKKYVTLLFEHVSNFADMGSQFKYLRLEESPESFNVVAVWKRSAENDAITNFAVILQDIIRERLPAERR